MNYIIFGRYLAQESLNAAMSESKGVSAMDAIQLSGYFSLPLFSLALTLVA